MKTVLLPSTASPWAGVWPVVVVHGLFAGLWFWLADPAIDLWFAEPTLRQWAPSFKACGFVALSCALLVALVRRPLRQEKPGDAFTAGGAPLLSAVVQACPDAIFAKDEHGRYLACNDAAAQLLGGDATAPPGADDRARLPPEQAQRLAAIDQQVRKSGTPETHELTVDAAGGEQRVYQVVTSALRNPQGQVMGTCAVARDTTASKAAEQELREHGRRLGAIVTNSPAVLSLKHPDGRYALANPNLQRVHSLSEQDILGKTDFDLYPEATAQALRDNDRLVLQTLQRQSIEEVVPTRGVPRTYMSHLFPVLDDQGQAQFVCRISLDITERKAAEEAMLRRTAELERFNRAATDRELRMVELKREVNEMARVAGRPAPYELSFADRPGPAAAP